MANDDFMKKCPSNECSLHPNKCCMSCEDIMMCASPCEDADFKNGICERKKIIEEE